jgi:cytochrome c553
MQVKYLKPILVTSALIGLSQWSGLSFAQTADQLYKSGALEGTIMPQLAKGYSDEQLITIANQLGKKQ